MYLDGGSYQRGLDGCSYRQYRQGMDGRVYPSVKQCTHAHVDEEGKYAHIKGTDVCIDEEGTEARIKEETTEALSTRNSRTLIRQYRRGMDSTRNGPSKKVRTLNLICTTRKGGTLYARILYEKDLR